MLQQAFALVHQRRQAEDAAFKRFSGKDFASDDLKREDALEDKYMSVVLNLLNALLHLPESEPLRRKTDGDTTSGGDNGSTSGDGGSTDNPIPSNPGTDNSDNEPTPQPNNGSENSGDDDLPAPSGGGTDNSE